MHVQGRWPLKLTCSQISTLVVFVHVNTTMVVKTEKFCYRIKQVPAYIKRYSEVHTR